MSIHRYTLEKYKSPASRFTCPSCGYKKEFTRYIDNETGLHLADHVGLCNRVDNCGYHFPPKEYFTVHPELKPERLNTVKQINKPPQVHIPFDEMVLTISGWENNVFYSFLKLNFGEKATGIALGNYPVGTMQFTHWVNATIFWYIDKSGNVRAGQVKQFSENGHTKDKSTNWYHTILKTHLEKNHESLPNWLPAYLEQHGKASCMFGEHLLSVRPNDPVAVVEAPKTAIIASMFYPEYVWVAVGAKSYLNTTRCAALKNRDVALFPDLGGFEEWTQRATNFYGLVKTIYLDTTLEDLATEEMRKNKEDFADYLVRCDLDQFLSVK
jgi:hypothetical protein